MATMITDECIACGACEGECPNDAIALGEEVFAIDPDLCSECVGFHSAQMCADACPVACCVPDPDKRENEEVLFQRAVAIGGDRGAELQLEESTSHFRAA